MGDSAVRCQRLILFDRLVYISKKPEPRNLTSEVAPPDWLPSENRFGIIVRVGIVMGVLGPARAGLLKPEVVRLVIH
jgi:hypothetical protein